MDWGLTLHIWFLLRTNLRMAAFAARAERLVAASESIFALDLVAGGWGGWGEAAYAARQA
jgi:hypothetical protein